MWYQCGSKNRYLPSETPTLGCPSEGSTTQTTNTSNNKKLLVKYNTLANPNEFTVCPHSPKYCFLHAKSDYSENEFQRATQPAVTCISCREPPLTFQPCIPPKEAWRFSPYIMSKDKRCGGRQEFQAPANNISQILPVTFCWLASDWSWSRFWLPGDLKTCCIVFKYL